MHFIIICRNEADEFCFRAFEAGYKVASEKLDCLVATTREDIPCGITLACEILNWPELAVEVVDTTKEETDEGNN